MSHQLPPFSVLRANYPDKSKVGTKALLDEAGGQLRDRFNDSVNTCAIRMSWCLNESGHDIRQVPSVPVYKGKVSARSAEHSLKKPKLFVVSADGMKKYLDFIYGPGQVIYDGRRAPGRVTLGGRKSVQGIVVFDWLGRIKDFGATGHVDLFFVADNGPKALPQFTPACIGTCYWWDGQPMVAYLWEAFT